MHPAYSVILFTTASGAGYGLLALLSIAGLLNLVPLDPWLGFTGFLVSYAFITIGLLSSTFHLGHPERAWRAFSQWRTSWLSREGVMAIATYVPTGMFALGWFFDWTGGWVWALLGWLGVVFSIVTVYCTGMIYASLKTIRQWHMPQVAPLYVLLAAATGAVLLNLLLTVFGDARPWSFWTAIVLLASAMLFKMQYWVAAETDSKSHTAGRATGLGRFGKVRAFEPPHSTPNFVMREMGHRVGRKHARTLRTLAVVFGFAIPIAASAMLLLSSPLPSWLWATVATVSGAIGILIERWLFFAEAQHVVTLFYGEQEA
ncbi:MAG: dimethyl sulfoxide reductase anchor subunit [Hyphomicrobiaceae bacterium]|nr:dimethyl sulfoxide reductase anchor subunit [Hyphomicrobiaceae bacterium]